MARSTGRDAIGSALAYYLCYVRSDDCSLGEEWEHAGLGVGASQPSSQFLVPSLRNGGSLIATHSPSSCRIHSGLQ